MKGKRGRPRKDKQDEIGNILKPYFENGSTAIHTSEVTGINRNTVNKYFRKWVDESKESDKRFAEKFWEKQKQAKEEVLVAYDEELLNLYRQQTMLKKELIHWEKDLILDWRIFTLRSAYKLLAC